jgi:translation initiation factor IF-1
MANSTNKVWWKCSNGHEWRATIGNRNKGRGCPYCSGKKVLQGYNDLETINPTLAKEWNFHKNGQLTPNSITANSQKKVWWKCSKGHEWQATIYHRHNGQGCPICNSEQRTSFPEYVLIFYLKNHGIEAIHSYRENGYELDIYIPSKKIAIEYDGYYWHKSKAKKDIEKNQKCKKDEIKLFRIREGLAPLNDSSIDYIVQRSLKDFPHIIQSVLSEIIGYPISIDLEKDAIAIENMREFTEKERSLLCSNPELASEWNYEKNGRITPELFLVNSQKKVWWKCANGHEWQAVISSRNRGSGCPYCAGQKVLKGKNDLQTVNPTLASEWNHEKNRGFTPAEVMAGSGKKVWWKCSEGHEWQATIANRNAGNGCPYCSGRKVLIGYNDLQTTNPMLCKEWNYEKNGILRPEEFTSNSGKKLWWKCANGHEWQATIASRNSGCGCPECAKQKRKKKDT